MKTPTEIEISLSALQHNFRFIRRLVKKNVKISSVVKGNAYGHGIEQYVPAAESCGINHFSVFSVDEASRVMKIKQPGTVIMIMGWIPADQLSWVIRNEIEFWIFDLNRLQLSLKEAIKQKKKARIHIELETGMNRTGLNVAEAEQVIDQLKAQPDTFELVGLCTHLAGAESIANHVRIHRQVKRFKIMVRLFQNHGFQPAMLHTASSAATITYPAFRFNMVRIGILQYGYWPSIETLIQYISQRKDKSDPLHRIIRWKSSIMALKQIKQGEFISYGTTYQAIENKTIAVIPAGYAQGYSRSLSNSGWVLIREQRLPIIGMINMNMLIADVTSIADAAIGDEVILIGEQGKLSISVASFSELSNQLNYELLSRLPAGITRSVLP
ncbi:MAG: alanine racemase [Lentimicrobium sp.]|nr:alanine racemase [Lentimicrobium sp.]